MNFPISPNSRINGGPKSIAVAAKRPKFLSWAVFPSFFCAAVWPSEAVDQAVLPKNPREAYLGPPFVYENCGGVLKKH